METPAAPRKPTDLKKVRFAARDPGAANVLAPLLVDWSTAGHSYELWALPQAAKIFTNYNLSFAHMDEPFQVPKLEALWCRQKADLLITGTSHYAPFEPILWKIARQHDCPSLAILDYWSNLERRFAIDRPNTVGAIDALQANALEEIGFLPEQIIIVGHPLLSAHRRQTLMSPPTLQKSKASGPVHVLFISEPISDDGRAGFNDPYGFDEFDSLRLLVGGARQAADGGIRVDIVIKPHPYEDPAKFRSFIHDMKPHPAVTVNYLESGESALRWIEWADVVTGISSILLSEAIIRGRPVVSIQPNLSRENTFIVGELGFARTLKDPIEAPATLARLIGSQEEQQRYIEQHRPFVEQIPTESGSIVIEWIEQKLSMSK